jgi:hypothetical protein
MACPRHGNAACGTDRTDECPPLPKPKKPLYCIAFTYRMPIPGTTKKKWVSDKLYVHADDAGEARLIFFRSENPRTQREINITGIAPAIGMFVEDNHGEVLSAD